jgi:radical SAM protein with 4Fe4S-binding SPASM domain
MADIGPRPRLVQIAPKAKPARKSLPLAPEVRGCDLEARPGYAVWEITLKCDLACRHCGSRAARERPDELSTAEALDMVRQMHEMGVREVTVIGGEAYLREDWHLIVKEIRSRGITCTMTTGGRALNKERARLAAEAGLQSVSVSIDGLRDTHDALRGVTGSYDGALHALANLAEVGIPVSVNTQICRPSRKEIEALYEILLPYGIHSWQIQITVAMGRAADEPELLLEPYHMLEVLPMVARLKKRTNETGVRLWPGNNIGYFGPYESFINAELPRGHMASCGAGRFTLGIEANGDIKGCPSLPTKDYVGGNIRENTLKDIWERGSAMRFTRDRTVDELWGYCRTCYYAEDCMAGCTWTGHVLFGKRGNNPYCHHRALEFLRQGKRERLVQVTPAEGTPFDYGIFELIVEDWPKESLARAQQLAAHGQGWLDDF